MAGHSKWANIKHRKAAQDAKRGKLFTKIIRELTVAAREGGNPDDNPRLRRAMDKALAANMVRDTIDRAIARGSGKGAGDDLAEVRYEGYGAGGAAVLVETMTDNRNRTVAEVRHVFGKRGGNLGTDGSVAYLFDRRGEIVFNLAEQGECVTALALEQDLEDLDEQDGYLRLVTTAENFEPVLKAFEEAELRPEHCELIMLPNHRVPLADKNKGAQLRELVAELEELDDVQEVFHNADLPAEE